MRVRPVIAAVGLVATLALVAASGLSAAARPSREPAEPYRPAVHFTPRANWMNDPNGLVYDRGTYHLFFQHNPYGTRWGNMSWGHATSSDLVHWNEQPLAIAQTVGADGRATEDIFSGSVVADTTNSSGFGTTKNPPLVAVYTSNYTAADPDRPNVQAQSLAYSTDRGRTWTKYAANPVLDRNSANFRDPKVFRYDGPAGSYWVMAAVEATEHRVLLYRSKDLRSWTYLSDFGPANATSGIWECPDLFPLQVEGARPRTTKWVLVVNLNPGAVNGGSGGQYFVGNFDGTRFTADSVDPVDSAPAGTPVASFDGGDWAGWQVDNEGSSSGPWGAKPASGALAGQQAVTGFVGAGLANGFVGGDWPVGTLTSPSFTVDRRYLNLLVGGGRHPRVANSQVGNEPPPGALLFRGFEYPTGAAMVDDGWDLAGDFTAARNPSTAGGEFFLGDKRINTWEGGPNGDDNTGTLTSPAFALDDDYLSFLLGGGRRTDGTLEVRLLVGDKTVASVTGSENGRLNWTSWDVRAHRGQQARLQVVDRATGGWGHLTLDHVVLGPEPARPRSEETTVNLVVDGVVVRSATGNDSETLDWASWDVAEFRGRQATITVVDRNRWGWGHLLVDQILQSDQAAGPRREGYDWLDWGRDYYAAVSYNNLPDRRVMVGWMNNWDYANDIPTDPWRSSMAFPREVRLEQTVDGPRLVQRPVDELAELRQRPALTVSARSVTGATVLPVHAETAEVTATFRPGTARTFGLTVLGRGDQRTVIGYDTVTGRLAVDRRTSGRTDFASSFASVDSAPVTLPDGRLRLRVLLDRASVEVFAQNGRTTITDQVFPDPGAGELGIFATGGSAQLSDLTVTPLRAKR